MGTACSTRSRRPLRPWVDVDGTTPLDHGLMLLGGGTENFRRSEQVVLVLQKLALTTNVSDGPDSFFPLGIHPNDRTA